MFDRIVTLMIGLMRSLRRTARHLPFWIKAPLKRILGKLSVDSSTTSIERYYGKWMKDYDALVQIDRDQIRAHIACFRFKPLISIIMPTYETPEWALQEAITSVQRQLYPYWELCIADDASKANHVPELLNRLAATDQRIKWTQRSKNGHIAAASNSALSLATGEYIALMDHDDLLSERALYEVAATLDDNPSLDIIYSDEDQIDRKGNRFNPYFKTDWNPDLLLGHNFVSHLGVYRRSLVERVGGFREGLEGSQDYDLALRCADTSQPDRIHHIPAILYHWRRDSSISSFSERQLERCAAAGRRAVKDHLDRRGEAAEVEPHPDLPNWNRVARRLPAPPPLVSLIVPTRDNAQLLGPCVEGLLYRTDYPALEVLIVDNDSRSPQTLQLFDRLRQDHRVRILKYPGDFNYSAINNMAATEAKGPILGLINNDIEVIDADWLSEMVALAVLPEVAAVGAKLLYPDNRVQHGGIAIGLGGIANSINLLRPRLESGYFGRNMLVSSVSAVTAACMVVRKSVFTELGGLDADHLAVAFNDVDFCLRARRKGYRNVWTPHAELYHRESSSRGMDASPEKAERLRREAEYVQATWGPELAHDPFYNVNFSTEADKCFQLAFPPLRVKPWRK